MNSTFESWLDAALYRSPAQPLFLWRASHRLTVLAYHGVDDAERFDQHLSYLTQVMRPVTIEDVCLALEGRRALPRRAVLVTFDDGDRSIVDVALPLLRARNVPAVAFVVAGLIDTNQAPGWVDVEHWVKHGGAADGIQSTAAHDVVRKLKTFPDTLRLAALDQLRRTAKTPAPGAPQLRREDLRRLEAGGVAIGNHTLTHPCLDQCDNQKVVHEVSQAHQRLTELLGKAPRSFAYPNGNADARVEETLAALGYEAGFLFDHKVCTLPLRRRFAISRVRVNSWTHADRFRIITSGLHPAIHTARAAMS